MTWHLYAAYVVGAAWLTVLVLGYFTVGDGRKRKREAKNGGGR